MYAYKYLIWKVNVYTFSFNLRCRPSNTYGTLLTIVISFQMHSHVTMRFCVYHFLHINSCVQLCSLLRILQKPSRFPTHLKPFEVVLLSTQQCYIPSSPKFRYILITSTKQRYPLSTHKQYPGTFTASHYLLASPCLEGFYNNPHEQQRL